jgi:hypothetical protein
MKEAKNSRFTLAKCMSFLHPSLFAASSVLIFYFSKQILRVYIPPLNVILPGLCVIAASLLLDLILYTLTRKSEFAGIITTLFMLGFLYLWQQYLIILGITLFCILLTRTLFKKVRYEDVNIILCILSISVFEVYLIKFLGVINNQPVGMHNLAFSTVPNSHSAKISSKQTPDIYYIILDAYGRADMLKSVFGFDNSSFINGLEQRGFVVAPQSQANYPRTLFSLSSSLNMQYLDSESTTMGASDLMWPIEDLIYHNEVRSLLEKVGYKNVFLSSGWDFTDIRDGDEYLQSFPIMLRDFTRDFINTNNLHIFENIKQSEIYIPSYVNYRHVILYSFDELPKAAELPGPKFVFSHILAPRPPYVFDSRGKPVDESIPYMVIGRPNLPDDKSAFIEQLKFVNQKTLEMIDGILEHSKVPPIIILQGDHGSNIYLNYDILSKTCLYERFSNLAAFYLPGVDPSVIPADISPVNEFRIIFNQYFGTNFDLLPNRRYFSADAHPYEFQDITNLPEIQCSNMEDALP